MELLLGLMVLVAGAVQLDGNSTVHVGPSTEGSTAPTVPVAGREPSLNTSSDYVRMHGLRLQRAVGFRPSPAETAIVVHRHILVGISCGGWYRAWNAASDQSKKQISRVLKNFSEDDFVFGKGFVLGSEKKRKHGRG